MMQLRPLRRLLSGAAFALAFSTTGAFAQELTVALTADAVHLDPQAGEELSSNIMFYHIYDPLVRRSAEMKFEPGLAESWELVDDTTWHFKLREGVTFHNGQPLTARDVVFTIERLKGALMSTLARNIASASEVDALTVEFKTPKPYAVLPNDLAGILILNEAHVKEVGDAQVDLTPVGTGPYQLAQWTKEDRLVLEAFDDYWAGAPAIKKVTFRPITNPATRTAALLTGEVDIIQDLSVRDVDRVKREADYSVISRPSLLNLVLALDTREKSPTIALDKNPMQDQRVREAITRAIDVSAIQRSVMNTFSTPSEQYVPESHIGYLPGASFREMYPYDVAAAKALMAEAGYADGFRMTLDATNNRYVNDQQIAQALAQMLAQIGITLDLNLMPRSNFFGHIRVPSDKSSFILSGWDVPSGDAGSMYAAMFHTRGQREGYGQVNRGDYSNPELDRLVIEADSTPDVAKRHEILQEATKVLMQDIPMIPLHYEQDIYAAKTSVDFKPRADKFIWAYDIPAPR